ncbi:MAG: transposase [Streptococcus sp.]|jgi:transposase|nr:transposase [Streptococcus sp.]
MGTNSDLEFLHFLIELERAIHEANKDNYDEFKSKLFFIFDNASIHLTKPIYQFFLKKGIVGITIPQYTPEMNPIEKVFRAVKCRMSRSNNPSK